MIKQNLMYEDTHGSLMSENIQGQVQSHVYGYTGLRVLSVKYSLMSVGT